MSSRWWEFDIGWMYIRLFECLAWRVYVAWRGNRLQADKSVWTWRPSGRCRHRMHVLANYAREVIMPSPTPSCVTRKTLPANGARQARRSAGARRDRRWTPASRPASGVDPERSQVLATVHRSRQQLQQVWERTASSQEALLARLQQWCGRPEDSGIKALQEFARSLRSYPRRPVG